MDEQLADVERAINMAMLPGLSCWIGPHPQTGELTDLAAYDRGDKVAMRRFKESLQGGPRQFRKKFSVAEVHHRRHQSEAPHPPSLGLVQRRSAHGVCLDHAAVFIDVNGFRNHDEVAVGDGGHGAGEILPVSRDGLHSVNLSATTSELHGRGQSVMMAYVDWYNIIILGIPTWQTSHIRIRDH